MNKETGTTIHIVAGIRDKRKVVEAGAIRFTCTTLADSEALPVAYHMGYSFSSDLTVGLIPLLPQPIDPTLQQTSKNHYHLQQNPV
jgi:hypothetical protein